MAGPKNGVDSRYPGFAELVKLLKQKANHVISCKTVPPSADGSGPIFLAHVYLDRREYTVSVIPTHLDGPDAR